MGYIGIMEKKMEAYISGYIGVLYYYVGVILGLHRGYTTQV